MTNAFFGRAARTCAALLAALAPALACAGTFGVAPLRLELGPKARTAVITVTNEGSEPLQLEVNPVAWTMDEAGAEQYTPTEDLAVYPPGLTVPPGQKRVVRVGIEGSPSAMEKTYRVFLKEQKNEGANGKPRGAQVSMLVNFGVPVFVSAIAGKPQLSGQAVAAAGAVEVRVQNTGSTRARIEGLALSGTAKDYASPYVLAGAWRLFRFPVTKQDCTAGTQQEVQLKLQDDAVVNLPVDLGAACK